MSQSESSLARALEELHRSLGRSGDLDADSRAALIEAAEEIQRALESGSDERGTGLSSRLQDAITRFEGDHPRLTEIVGRLADQLAEMGI